MTARERLGARRHPPQPGRTGRRDAWWVEPVVTIVILGGFILYSLWAVLQGSNYVAEPYLSPFYSPLLRPDWWPYSPAILIMWAPLGFRLTCYYYRKAYYRAFFWDPPACAVGEARRGDYGGEARFPYVLQNLHRFTLFAAAVVLLFLWYDTIHAFFFPNGFGVGLGTLVLLANVVLLTGYTLSCHSFRHLIGGGTDCFTCSAAARMRYGVWRWASALNGRHAFWAWTSLVSVAVADLYVRLVASGAIRDVRLF
ncbi:MAG: succinate dehydrogenase [Chloroflexi bacterium]|nr:succinate dehydrogenase [Chloroflexota bacterium]